MEEYFIVRGPPATYLCRRTKGGCWIIAQKGRVSGRWIKFRKQHFWKWHDKGTEPPDDPQVYYSGEPKSEEVPVSKEEAVALLLMGKREKLL
mgnify:FL=1